MTAGYNGVINQRQFRLPEPWFPTEYRYPDRTYRGRPPRPSAPGPSSCTTLRRDRRPHLAWIADRKVLCAGDMFIWVSPNCGNRRRCSATSMEWAAGCVAWPTSAPSC